MPGALAMIARASIRELGWWLAGTGRLWWRHKLRASAHAVLTLLAWLERWELVLLLLFGPVVGLAVWARLGPVSYTRRCAAPISRRRLRRDLRRSWPVIMESVGLASRTPHGPAGADSQSSVHPAGGSGRGSAAAPAALGGRSADRLAAAAHRADC
jgi:hypothetical protein